MLSTDAFILLADTSMFLLGVTNKPPPDQVLLHWRVTVTIRGIWTWIRAVTTIRSMPFMASSMDPLVFPSNMNYGPSNFFYCRRRCNKEVRSILLRSKPLDKGIYSTFFIEKRVVAFFLNKAILFLLHNSRISINILVFYTSIYVHFIYKSIFIFELFTHWYFF